MSNTKEYLSYRRAALVLFFVALAILLVGYFFVPGFFIFTYLFVSDGGLSNIPSEWFEIWLIPLLLLVASGYCLLRARNVNQLADSRKPGR